MTDARANDYDRSYFTAVTRSALVSARQFLPAALSVLPNRPRSVADFGCAEGAWLSVLQEINPQTEIFGVDYASAVTGTLIIPPDRFHAADLEAQIDLGRKFDLVISLEVAEHLKPEAAETFVATLTRHSDQIIFSAAIPGQGAATHFNCQWPSYWRALFKKHGFACFDTIRPLIWENEEIEFWYRQNALLFVRDPSSKSSAAVDWGGHDLVHPKHYDSYRRRRVARSPRNLYRFITGQRV